MNTTLAPQDCSLNQNDAMAAMGSPEPMTIKMELSLAADTRRIFEALTVPEYMELWMSLPGYHPMCHSRAYHHSGGFVFDHLCDHHAKVRVVGTYAVRLRRKLIFTWAVSGSRSTSTTFADIRLSGAFEKSVLRLRHSGFASEEDYAWHLALWSASLNRLARLLGGVTGVS